jgi:hypothetical protein
MSGVPLPSQEFDATGWIEPVLSNDGETYELLLRFNPLSIDIDIIDFADWMGDLFDKTVRKMLDKMAGGLIGAIFKIIGDFISWILREVFDFLMTLMFGLEIG